MSSALLAKMEKFGDAFRWRNGDDVTEMTS